MSGLTMGLMSMDTLNLNIIKNSGTESERKCASRILPLVQRHHLLLVTLLLTNAAASEALPIVLDRLVHPAVAIAMSVSLVLLFGEIIPQAVCTRYGLQIGAGLSWLVWILIGALFVIAWPISKLLDFLLGSDHGTFFRRAELKELVHLHAEDLVHSNDGESLTVDEVRIIKGAIDLNEKTVLECMTPFAKVFALSTEDKLDRDMLKKIVDAGHDRIPVYHSNRKHWIGMILIKDLVLVDPNEGVPVDSVALHQVPFVDSDMPLYNILHQFQAGHSHMAIVLDPNDHITPVGIITLEDVMEELLQEDILDEDDLRRTKKQKQIMEAQHHLIYARAFMPRNTTKDEGTLRRNSTALLQSLVPRNNAHINIAPTSPFLTSSMGVINENTPLKSSFPAP